MSKAIIAKYCVLKKYIDLIIWSHARIFIQGSFNVIWGKGCDVSILFYLSNRPNVPPQYCPRVYGIGKFSGLLAIA